MKIVKPITFTAFKSTRASPATYYNSAGLIGTAGVDITRFTYNPTTLEPIGPLLEAEATNIFTYSEDFSNTVWSNYLMTVALEAGQTAPDDTLGAYSIISAPNINHVIYRANPVPVGVTCTFSVYAKDILDPNFPSVDYLRIGSPWSYYGYPSGAIGGSWFKLEGAGSIAANTTGAVIQKLPNGWYRCSVTGVSTGAGNFSIGANNHKYLIWGAQLEIGSAASSYIPTIAATVTRAEDIVDTSPPRLIETNVDENDAVEWDGTTPFTTGEEAIVLGQVHRLYEALGATTGDYPPENPDVWLDKGATNPWRMFDMLTGPEKQTVSTDSSNTVRVLLDLDEPVNSVTLLNLEGVSVRIIMRDSEGNEVYNRFINLLQNTSSPDWWSFFFATRYSIKTVGLTDLPITIPSTIEMILEGDALPAKIGKMIVGNAVDIGCARYGTSVGIVDFSRKERDPFGNNFILERRYIDRADYDVQILTSNIDNVKDLLASIRATPALYIGDEDFNSTVIYGFYRDFSIVISGPRKSDASIQVESI